jgi:hypothetical protein
MMTTITFDTLAYSKKLRDAGFSEQQAEAQALALASVLKETSGDIATKQDVERLSDKVEARFKLLQWMLGFNLALSTAVLWAVIRAATH